MPDVDGENHAGAVGEQHFREAAGRGADIETDVILDRESDIAPARLQA